MRVRHLIKETQSIFSNNKNIFWYTGYELIASFGMVFSSVYLFQSFMTKINFSNSSIGVIMSAATMATAIGLFLFLGMADKIREKVKALFWSYLSSKMIQVLFVLVVLFSLKTIDTKLVFYIVLIRTIFQSIAGVLTIMLTFSVIVNVIKSEIRAKIIGFQGFLNNMTAIFISLISILILKTINYPFSYMVSFSVSALCFIGGGLLLRKVRISELSVKRPEGNISVSPLKAFVLILRKKEFRTIAFPEIIRGIISGIASFIMIAGIRKNGYPLDSR